MPPPSHIVALIVATLSFGCADEVVATDTAASASTVTIATFNIQIFGKDRRGEPEVMEVLVDISDEFDIMAAQEVRDASGDTPGVYLDAMNAQGDEAHEMIVGPDWGGHAPRNTTSSTTTPTSSTSSVSPARTPTPTTSSNASRCLPASE